MWMLQFQIKYYPFNCKKRMNITKDYVYLVLCILNIKISLFLDVNKVRNDGEILGCIEIE